LVFENEGLDATRTIVPTDLALSAWLATTVPADVDIVPSDAGLPPLPSFVITLHAAEGARAATFDELSRQLRDVMARPRVVA